VLQVAEADVEAVTAVLANHGLADISHVIGSTTAGKELKIRWQDKDIFVEKISGLNRIWSELTYRMQALRDNPEYAKQEYDNLLDEDDPGMQMELSYEPSAPHIVGEARPRMAILREQGINGQVEMAAVFDRAGFECVDMHMTDLLEKRADLGDFAGLVACGGFSYGDVLGAGSGWAKSVLFNPELKEMFAKFFAREDSFALGVCNGCQMISQLKGIIPGAEHWPEFTRNRSEQFEARFVTVEVLPSPSIFMKGMEGSKIGIPVAHGEGLADFGQTGSQDALVSEGLVALRYIDNYGRATERYPFNPNGSPDGMTGLTTVDGRVTIMMPHPERVFRSLQLSYCPHGLCKGDEGPWLRMFRNARNFAG
jgi:phosphoribosylformylglycinamidine synthase